MFRLTVTLSDRVEMEYRVKHAVIGEGSCDVV